LEAKCAQPGSKKGGMFFINKFKHPQARTLSSSGKITPLYCTVVYHEPSPAQEFDFQLEEIFALFDLTPR
jgi:hypothetical protein